MNGADHGARQPQERLTGATHSTAISTPNLPSPLPSPSPAALSPKVSTSPPLRALDLFTGTGSVAQALREQGYVVDTVDVDPRWNPTFLRDVSSWAYHQELVPGSYDVVWASVPCTEYSIALTTRPRRLEEADRLVRKTLKLIEFLRPRRWFIENPRWGLLRHRDFMQSLPFVDVDYCMFSHAFGFQKPTRV